MQEVTSMGRVPIQVWTVLHWNQYIYIIFTFISISWCQLVFVSLPIFTQLKKEVPHSVRGRSCSFSAQAYSRSERHPYNNRAWTAVYVTTFYDTKWLWVLRLHDEYTYQAANTHAGMVAWWILNTHARVSVTLISDRKSSCRVTR